MFFGYAQNDTSNTTAPVKPSALKVKVLCNALILCISLYFSVLGAEQVILDTDIGGDVDDLGTVAVLHALANRGEISIKATISCTDRYAAVSALDAINTFYNRPDIPVAYKDGILHKSNSKFYCEFISENFPYDINPQTAPQASSLYRKLLAESADNSIIVVSVGGLCNIYNLLHTGSDTHSNLDGTELFNKKVKRFAVMGGGYPQGNQEANFKFSCYDGAARTVFEKVKVPTLFSGANLGLNDYMTGTGLMQLQDSHIVKAGYLYFCKNPPDYMTWLGLPQNTIIKTATYDQCALIGGVRMDKGYFKIVSHGYNDIENNGSNTWRTDQNRAHQMYQTTGMDPATVAREVIEPLMMELPQQITGDYSLNTSVIGKGSISISPQKSWYEKGESVTLTAQADPGSIFDSWTGGHQTSESSIRIVMNSNISLTATFKKDPEAPIITNGDFSNDATAWTLYQFKHDGINAEASLHTDESIADIRIDNPGSEGWHVQLLQEDINITEPEEYLLTFDLQASAQRPVHVALKTIDPEIIIYHQTITASTQMQTYSAEISLQRHLEKLPRIEFNLGSHSGDVRVDNVVLTLHKQTQRRLTQQHQVRTKGVEIIAYPTAMHINGLSRSGWKLELFDLLGNRLQSAKGNNRSIIIHLDSKLQAGTMRIARLTQQGKTVCKAIRVIK